MTAACSLPSHGQSCPGFDAGLDQAGLAEVVVQSVSACDPVLQPLLYSNILLTGEASYPVASLLRRRVHAARPICPVGRGRSGGIGLREDARAGKESKSAALFAVQGAWHACLASRSDWRPSCGPLCRPTWSSRSMYQPTRSPMHGRQDQGGTVPRLCRAG